jgi:hypothetical protein
MVEPATVWTLFVLCPVFGDQDLKLGIMNLSPLDLDRFYMFQRGSTSFTDQH